MTVAYVALCTDFSVLPQGSMSDLTRHSCMVKNEIIILQEPGKLL